MKRKIAIAGLGAAAREIHIPAYAKLSELEIIGGCDPAVTSGNFNFPIFSSLDLMLEKTRPDILAVTAPTDFHYDLTRQGLMAGCHVLCEKPFMSSLEEANTIIALAKEVNRLVVVNNQYRFMNVHRAAKNLIGTAEFGELLFVTAHQAFFVSEHTEAGWRGQDPRRTCKEFGTHVLDLCRFYFDEDPVTVYARMPKGKHPEGPDLLNLIQLEFSGDRMAHITLDRLSRGKHRYLDMRLDGSAGTVETSLGGRVEVNAGIRARTRKPYINFDIAPGGRARLYHGERFRKIAADPLDLFAHATMLLLKAFLNALDNNTVPPCNADDNRRTLALMLAAYESQERNMPIGMHY